MTSEQIHIDQLMPALFATLEGDDELVLNFDPGCYVINWENCVTAICQKLKGNYPEATYKIIKKDHKTIAYYVFEGDLLISFAIHIAYRNKEYLTAFWDLVKSEFPGPFSCVLYSKNERAIRWLRRSGMKLLFDHVSILTLCPQEDLD